MKKKDKDLKTESKLMRALRADLEKDIQDLDRDMKRWIMKLNAFIEIVKRKRR
jgi:hypothetical protein